MTIPVLIWTECLCRASLCSKLHTLTCSPTSLSGRHSAHFADAETETEQLNKLPKMISSDLD